MRYFKRIRTADIRSHLKWRRKIEAATERFDERQSQVVERYAETVRLHIAYLDEITEKLDFDFRADFAEFMLLHHKERRR